MRRLRNFLRLALNEYSLSERVGLFAAAGGTTSSASNEMSDLFLIYKSI